MYWLLIILFIIVVYIWYHPNYFLSPLNFIYRLDTSSRTNFYQDYEKDNIFPVGLELESQWEKIKEEGYQLYQSIPNKEINYLDNYHIDLKEENKLNWTTIPLRLFGQDTTKYFDYCPTLSNILKEHPEIISCLYSIMEPGKIITPHHGPYDGLIRYQLALDIPNIKEGEECYLHVDGEKYQWSVGKGVLFDESNIHGAVNTTSEKRMVLLIDIERPYSSLIFRILNRLIISIMGLLPATTNALLI